MTTMTTDRFTDKTTTIQRLLAKAESTTPEEAEALTEAAERLMVKHGIDAAMLAAKRQSGEPEKIVTESVQFSGTYVYGELLMASAVVQAFGTMRVYKSGTTSSPHMTLHIVGFESDVAQAKTLISSLTLQSVVAMRAWWKANREEYRWYSESEKKNVRRQFIISFGQGAAERIKAATTEILAESDTEEGTSNALVLVNRKSQVDEHLDGSGLRLRSARGIRGGGRNAHEAGQAAGRVANTGGSAVGSGAKGLGR